MSLGVWRAWAITATVMLVGVASCSVMVIRDRNVSDARMREQFEDYKKINRIACKQGICE